MAADYDSLAPATRAALEAACALDWHDVIHPRRLAQSARESLTTHARTLTVRRRALRALQAIAPEDRQHLPPSTYRSLQTSLRRVAAVRAALPARDTGRPGEFPHLQAAMAAAIAQGEPPTTVVRYVVAVLLPQIPYEDPAPSADAVAQRVRQILDRLRKARKNTRKNRKAR